MSGLKERLLRLKRSENGAAASGGLDGASGAAEQLLESQPAESKLVDGQLLHEGWEQLGGVRVERNAIGAFLLRERMYALDHRHGHECLSELTGLASELGGLASGGSSRPVSKRRGSGGAARRDAMKPCGSAEEDAQAMESSDASEQGLQHERLLFFDTETTGLGIGAGNVAFMIGLGFYQEDCFVVQQLFIRNPAEEAAMLAYFEQLLGRFTHIVSYNGRSFDWPIVQSRFVLARRRRDLGDVRHIDLLYPARALWKTSLPSCRLSAVETGKLGFRREGDVPGSMAPVLYVQYLAERSPSVITGVFVHNEHDIVSLAALAVHMAKLLRGEPPTQELQDEEMLRLSMWLGKLGRSELAEQTRERLGLRLLGGGVRPGRERLMLELAAAYKRCGRYESAAELWRRFVAERGGSFACPVEPYIELAMYGEHRQRRYGEALAYAEEALNRVWKRMSLTRVDDKQRELVEALQKRIRRLQGKQRREKASAETASSTGEAARQAAAGSTTAWPTQQPSAKRVKPEYALESLI